MLRTGREMITKQEISMTVSEFEDAKKAAEFRQFSVKQYLNEVWRSVKGYAISSCIRLISSGRIPAKS